MSLFGRNHRGIVDATWRSASRTSSRRCLSTTPRRQGSPLFALGALSNARETQHLAKESRLPRVQHSPNLQLIQSSEVAPFAPPKPASAALQPALERTRQPALAVASQQPAASPVTTAAALDGLSEAGLASVGRAILAEKNAELSRLQQALAQEKDRSEKREATYALARTKSRDRIARLHSDLNSEKLWKWMLILVGAGMSAWVYASRNGKLSYSFGDAFPKMDSRQPEKPTKRKLAASSPDSSTGVQPQVRTVGAPHRAVVAESPSPALPPSPPPSSLSLQPSWLGRLFWSS